MSYSIYLLLMIMILGVIGMASNPIPSFAALSLVVVAGGGCGILMYLGGVFLSLVLFLIYLGGMMVVFAYSVAFAASLSSEGWGSGFVTGSIMVYFMGAAMSSLFLVDWGFDDFWMMNFDYWKDYVIQMGLMGVSMLYSLGGVLLIAGGWALLLVLFVVLKLARGFCLGSVRSS